MFRHVAHVFVLGGLSVGLGAPAAAQGLPGTVRGVFKLSDTQGGVIGPLRDEDQLGRSVAVLGDVDGNGVPDLASAGLGDDDGGIDRGAVHVLFLRADGRVIRDQKISSLAGGFTGDLDDGDQFGRAVAGIGDLDGDGVPDLAVGCNYDDDGGPQHGAVWLLRLNRDGTVKSHSKISDTQGNFTAFLRNNDEFGRSVAALGDLDGNGVVDLAASAPTDSTGGLKRGAVYVLFLNPDGSVLRHVKIASGTGGFTGRLRNTDWFGFSLASLGDFDGDGVTDLAVGAALDDDGAPNAGAVWLLYLRRDGTVKDQRKISMLSGGFTGVLEYPDQFGTSVARVGDLDGDGVTELAVGAVKDDDGATDAGAVYVLFLTPEGSVKSHVKISGTSGDMPRRTIGRWDWFGSALAPLGDLDGDGVPDLAIGARNDDDGGPNRGAIYLTYLRGTSALALTAAATSGAPAHAPAGAGTACLDVLVSGAGPEPAGDLEVVEASADRLRLRLVVPEDLAGRGGRLRLYFARAADPAASADGPEILARVERDAAPGQTVLEVDLLVPAGIALDGLRFRGLWSGARYVWTDTVTLALQRGD